MADARKLPSGRWQARWRDGTGKRAIVPGGTHRTQKEARTAAILHEQKVALGPRNRSDALTWNEWCDRWWPTRLVEKSTLGRDASRRDVHLRPQWGDVALVKINRQDIREWAARLASTPTNKGRTGGDASGPPLSGSSVQRIVHLLSASLNAAVDAELLAVNPAAKLKLAPPRQGAEHFITRAEFERIADELDEHQLRMATFLFGTGLRWGEAAGLHWDRVDLDRGVVYVMEVLDDKDRVIKPYPKGRQAREVPLPDFVLDLLPQVPPSAGVCGLEHSRGGTCRSPLVLTTARGNPWDAANFRHGWYLAVELAAVEHTRVHDLRHSYASWLLNEGLELERIGALLGHVSPITTRRYAHLVKGHHDEVRAILNRRPSNRRDRAS